MPTLEKRLERVNQERNEIKKRIDERNKKKSIPCKACGKPHKIGELTLIQTHYYVPPRGCTEGDYWRPGEMQIVCPETQVRNRLLFNNDDVPYEEREKHENDPQAQFKEKYKHLFRKVEDVHDEKTEVRTVNNYYVNEHRTEFDLVEVRSK